ncbi:unnamed protein product [Lepidochelys olivacea]
MALFTPPPPHHIPLWPPSFLPLPQYQLPQLTAAAGAGHRLAKHLDGPLPPWQGDTGTHLRRERNSKKLRNHLINILYSKQGKIKNELSKMDTLIKNTTFHTSFLVAGFY